LGEKDVEPIANAVMRRMSFRGKEVTVGSPSAVSGYFHSETRYRCTK